MDQRLPLFAVQLTLAAVVLAAWPALGRAQSARIPAEAERAYLEGDYETAARLLRESYAASPSTDALYAWAQAERMAGNCDEAVGLYRRVLSSKSLSDQDRLAAESGIRECDKAESTQPPTSDEAVRADDSARAAGTRPSAWPSLTVGTLGAIALAAGGGLYVNARSLASSARDAPDARTFEERRDRAETRRNWAAVSAGVGATLLTTSVILYFARSKSSAVTPAVNVQVGRDAAGAAIAWSF